MLAIRVRRSRIGGRQLVIFSSLVISVRSLALHWVGVASEKSWLMPRSFVPRQGQGLVHSRFRSSGSFRLVIPIVVRRTRICFAVYLLKFSTNCYQDFDTKWLHCFDVSLYPSAPLHPNTNTVSVSARTPAWRLLWILNAQWRTYEWSSVIDYILSVDFCYSCMHSSTTVPLYDVHFSAGNDDQYP